LLGEKKIRAISMDVALFPHVGDAITKLTNEWVWKEVGDSVADVIASCKESVESWYSDMMIGQVSFFLGSVPDYWLALDGGTYSGDDYPELMGLLDSQFVDEGQNEFTLPDVGGLFPIVSDDVVLLGDTGGLGDVTLSVDEMPAHTHNYQQVIVDVDVKTVGVPDPLGARLGIMIPTSSAGGGASHENKPPYFAMVVGIFSGRVV
jgi:microcystin-dependent protein